MLTVLAYAVGYFAIGLIHTTLSYRYRWGFFEESCRDEDIVLNVACWWIVLLAAIARHFTKGLAWLVLRLAGRVS